MCIVSLENQRFIRGETNAAMSIGRDGKYARIRTLGTTTTTTGNGRGELFATTLPLQPYNHTSTIKEVNATRGTTDEAVVATIRDGHHHTSYQLDQEASKPVDDGFGSTDRIGSYSHSTSTDSTTSKTPDVSPSLTSFILGKLQSKASHKWQMIVTIKKQWKKIDGRYIVNCKKAYGFNCCKLFRLRIAA